MRRLVLAAVPALALVAACEGATSATAPVARPRAMTSIAGDSFAVTGGGKSTVLFSHVSGYMAGGCLPEPVEYTGLTRQSFNAVDTPSGQQHTTYTSNFQIDSAYGAITGKRYQVVQVYNSSTATTDYLNWDAPATTVQTFKVLSSGFGPGVLYTYQTTATYHKDASGRVTADAFEITEGCGGPERFHVVSH